MNINFSTNCLDGYGLNRVFEIAKSAGFFGVDLNIKNNSFDTQDENYLKKIQEEYEIKIQSIILPYEISIENIKKTIILASRIDVKKIIIYPPLITDFYNINFFKKEIINFGKNYSVEIILSNVGNETIFGIVPKRIFNSLNFQKIFGSSCLDIASLEERKESSILAIEKLGKNLKSIHISDLDAKGVKCLIGKGIIPLESVFGKLKKIGYKNEISYAVPISKIFFGDEKELILLLKEQKEKIENML